MFPIKDDNPTRRTPWVTYLLILANITAFGYEVLLTLEGEIMGFIYAYSLIPAHVAHGYALHTLVTSMFLHSGFMHIFGNMLYLFIFGDNIEDIMGRGRFILFYLLCGFAASFSQILVNPYSGLPNLGASGAVAGVLGAYLVTFPRARVHCILILGYFIRWVPLPAMLVLGFWFVIQFFSGVASLPFVSQEVGGVAYFAHIGGFIAGALLVRLLKRD
jgi:membrane associated rhomboid family serine protease